MKSQRPITLAGIDTEVYRIRRRANLLLVVIDTRLGKKISTFRRSFLESLRGRLIEIDAMPYLLKEKVFPASHYHTVERKVSYPAIVKLYREIIRIYRELLEKIVIMELAYEKTTIEFQQLGPIETWNDWVDSIIRKTDKLLNKM